MAKDISPELKAHLAESVTTIATCWRLERTDGITLYFTDHDKELVVDGDTYSPNNGYKRSAVSSSSGLATGNLSVDGVIDNSSITDEDIRAGRYDNANVEMFVVNWNDLSMGKLVLKKGDIGDISLSTSFTYNAELRGLTDRLSQRIGELYSGTCRANLGDTRCGVSLVGSFVEDLVAITSTEQTIQVSSTKPDGFFNGGKIEFITGENAGLFAEVRTFSGNILTLLLPTPFRVINGDQIRAYVGCDKSIETCAATFDNAKNFRGEPYIPGRDSLTDYPGNV